MDRPPAHFTPAQFSEGFLDRSGPYFLRREASGIIVGLSVLEGHLNYVGRAHGGVLLTLADVAMSLQVYESEEPPLALVTNSITTNFVGAAKLGDWLEAHARIDRLGKRIAYTSGEIRRGEEIVATMTGVFTILRSS
jgi:acyl-coenzyme A thioesterase 13